MLLAQLAIAVVLIWNVQCAVAFLVWPENFNGSFELLGTPGEAAVRGVGLLFLMWNVPYALALWRPARHRLSLYEATAMQAIGLVGETYIRSGIPIEYVALRGGLARFIAFDGAGLILLLLAIWLIKQTDLA